MLAVSPEYLGTMQAKKPSSREKRLPVTTGFIAKCIHLVRDQKVMLDHDLAALYDVPTSRLNEAVKRNPKRFPPDFKFRLRKKEAEVLLSQNAIAKSGRGGRRNLPTAFTEQGVAMLSSVLNSDRAIRVNVAIMQTFVRIREVVATHKELADKVAALETSYGKHDEQIQAIFQAIRQLLTPPPAPPRRRIGFETGPAPPRALAAGK